MIVIQRAISLFRFSRDRAAQVLTQGACATMTEEPRPIFLFDPTAIYDRKTARSALFERFSGLDVKHVRLIEIIHRICYANVSRQEEADVTGEVKQIIRDIHDALTPDQKRRLDELGGRLMEKKDHKIPKQFDGLNAVVDKLWAKEETLEQEVDRLIEDIQTGGDKFSRRELHGQLRSFRTMLQTNKEALEREIDRLIEDIQTGSDEYSRKELHQKLRTFRTMLRTTHLTRGRLGVRVAVAAPEAFHGHRFAARMLSQLGRSPRLMANGEATGHALPELPERTAPEGQDPDTWREVSKKHYSTMRQGIMTFISELGDLAHLRDSVANPHVPEEELKLRARLRPVCYVVNHYANQIELLDLYEGKCPDWLQPLRFPQAVRATGVARSLAPQFLGFEGPGMRLRAWSTEELVELGSSQFTTRESVGALWTVHICAGSWQLLILLNWIEPDDTTPLENRPAPLDEGTCAVLDELYRDTHSGARQLASWIAASDIDLEQPATKLFTAFSEFAVVLKEALNAKTCQVLQERLVTLTRNALGTMKDKPKNRGINDFASLVAPIVRPADATAFSQSLIFDEMKSTITVKIAGGVDEVVSIDEGDVEVIKAALARSAHPRMVFLGRNIQGPGGRRVYDCDLEPNGMPKEGLVAMSAAWCTPMLVEDLKNDELGSHLWRALSKEDVNQTQVAEGTEINVPIPGELTNGGTRRAAGVITVHTKKLNVIGQREARAIDAIARIYGYLRFAQHDPALRDDEPAENQELLDRVLDMTEDARIERVLAMANKTILEWYKEQHAALAYFLIRDFEGAPSLRNVGLACDKTTLERYFEHRGPPVYASKDIKGEERVQLLNQLKTTYLDDAMRRVVLRSIRSHFVPRRRGFTYQIIREADGRVLSGRDELDQTASRPALLRCLDITRLVGLVFKSPLAARPLGCLWIGYRGDELKTQQARDKFRADHERRLGSLLNALGALVSLDRICTHSGADTST